MPADRTLGIDLASQAKRTAACVIDWSGPDVEVLDIGFDDSALLGLVADADKTGIDAPLGWPVAFRHALRDDLWPDRRKHLVHRATDRWVHSVTGKTPLSVSADRIAYCAMRAASLLTRLEDVDRTGVTGPVCEVYPDPSLRLLGLRDDTVSYKRGAREARSAIVKRLPAWVQPAARKHCEDSDDHLDALVCALVARAVVKGHSCGPPPMTSEPPVEGWIHLPTMSAEELR